MNANANTGGKSLLIAGGGTGGHVFPALAVAREWLRRESEMGNHSANGSGGGAEHVVFVGTERGMEAKLVRGHGDALPLPLPLREGGGSWRTTNAAGSGPAPWCPARQPDRRSPLPGYRTLPLLGRTHIAITADLVDVPVDLKVVAVRIGELDRELTPARRRPSKWIGTSCLRRYSRARSTSSSVETSNAI